MSKRFAAACGVEPPFLRRQVRRRRGNKTIAIRLFSMPLFGHNITGAALMKSSGQQLFIIPDSFPFMEIRATADSVLPYAEHFHSSFSFGLILAGRTCFSLGKKTYVAEAGDIVLIAPGQAHSCNPVGERPRSYRMAHIDPLWFHGSLGLELCRKDGLRVATPLIRDAELFAEACDLFDMACAGTVMTEPVLTALLTKMHGRHQCFLPAPEAQRPDVPPPG